MIEHQKNNRETAYLIAVQTAGITRTAAENHLAELKELAETLEIEIAGSQVVSIEKPAPDLFIGSGKAAEIIDHVKNQEIRSIIFDDDLSPSQQRNWERRASVPVLDRREIILEIFARHAHTHESMLQIELARLEYTLPRLKRAWTHLSRQQGGSRGTRGEGEKQIELDRRTVIHRINTIKKNIEQIKKHRTTRRKKRYSAHIPSFSIIGYTNAGKSSLLNALTGAGVTTENKLFATLDPTTRKTGALNGLECLLTDTVGFIRKLPTDLIDAFHSTLEEASFSDFLIHVVDISNPEYEEHIKTTDTVLRNLGIIDKPVLMVFNKTDLIPRPEKLTALRKRFPAAVFISVKTGAGFNRLSRKVHEIIKGYYTQQHYSFPNNRHDLVAFVHRNGKVIQEDYHADTIQIDAEVTEYAKNVLEKFSVRYL